MSLSLGWLNTIWYNLCAGAVSLTGDAARCFLAGFGDTEDLLCWEDEEEELGLRLEELEELDGTGTSKENWLSMAAETIDLKELVTTTCCISCLL